MDLISELLVTISNELNNNKDWSFDGANVVSAEVVRVAGGRRFLGIELNDDRAVVLAVTSVEDYRQRLVMSTDVRKHAGHNLVYDDDDNLFYCATCSIALGELKKTAD